MNMKLAKITKANLEIKERGILNFWIFVNYEDGCSQGIGGISLDEFDKKKDRRVGTSYGCEMIRQLLLTLNVNDFSEMEGLIVWVIGDGDGLGFTPKGLKTLNVDKKQKEIIFSNVADEFIK